MKNALALTCLAVLTLSLSGCFTVVTWVSAGNANEDVAADTVLSAELQGETLRLIADFDGDLHTVLVNTSGPTDTISHRPLHEAQLGDDFNSIVPPSNLRIVEGMEFEDEGQDGTDPPPLLQAQVHYVGDSDGLTICLRRPGQEPVYALLPKRKVGFSGVLAYTGAVLITPVTVALDLATSPIQLVIFVVFLNSIPFV